MSVKDFKEEIIKNNQLVIRWDFIVESHETKYKVWVEKEYMKMFVISNELTKEKHDLEEFLNKKYEEYKAQNTPKKDAPLASEEHQHQKHLMEKEAQRKKEEAEMKTKAQFHQDDSPEKFGKIGDVAHFGNCKPYFAELIIKEVTEQIQKECNEHQKRVDKLLDDYTKKVSGKFDLEAENINDVANSLDKSGEDMECPNDGLLSLIKQMYPNAKCIWLGESELEPKLSPKDLIQAARDELVRRVKFGKTPAHNVGFVYCIEFMEETMGKDPYKN